MTNMGTVDLGHWICFTKDWDQKDDEITVTKSKENIISNKNKGKEIQKCIEEEKTYRVLWTHSLCLIASNQ